MDNQFNPNNKLIQLLLQGMGMEDSGKPEEASLLFSKAWSEATADFEKFIAWQTDYAFVSTSDSLKDRPVMDRDEFTAQMMDGKNKMLAFISLQDLKGAM